MENLINKVPTFLERKKEWLSAYDNDVLVSKEELAKYKSMVSTLEDRDYYVIGYGSLLNRNDVYRTSPNLVSHEKAYIKGWRRIFNMGSPHTGSYLNVKKTLNQSSMIVALLRVPAEDMPNVFIREINYTFEQVAFTQDNGNEGTAFMVFGQSTINNNIHPQLNYLHLCIQGAAALGGAVGVDNFISTTDTNFGPLRSWFGKYSMEYIMRSHLYLSR